MQHTAVSLIEDHRCCLEKCDWLITTIPGVSCIMLESIRFSLIFLKNRNQNFGEKAVDAIIEIMKNPDEAKKRAEAAYQWVNEYTWENVCKQWTNVFNRALNKVKSAELLKKNFA